MQDHHVTYREIERTLSINGTSIHSILHEHLTVKQNLFALDATQFVNRSKKRLVSIGRKKCSKNTNRGASKHVTGDISWIYAYEPESKQQSNVCVSR